MPTFGSENHYVISVDTISARIERLDEIIDALLNTVLSATENADVQEYMLDDGQTKIKKVYRSPSEVFASIERCRKLKSQYASQLNGRIFQFRHCQ